MLRTPKHNLFEVNHCAQEKLILMYGINEIKQIYKMFVNALVQMCNIFVYSMSFVPCTSNKFLPVRQGLSLEEIESFTLQSSLQTNFIGRNVVWLGTPTSAHYVKEVLEANIGVGSPCSQVCLAWYGYPLYLAQCSLLEQSYFFC